MAQAAHAATAVLHENADSPEVKEYLQNLASMRKTVMEVSEAHSPEAHSDGRYRTKRHCAGSHHS
jgi:hypothetical protein